MGTRSARSFAVLLFLLIGLPLPAEDGAVGPITLREARDEGGWFVYAEHDGTLEDIGSRFLRFAIYGAHASPQGYTLAVVLLESGVDGPTIRAEVGIILDSEPARVPGAWTLRKIEPRRVAVGEGTGNWGNALVRAREVRAWAQAVGLQPAGAPRLVFRGDPTVQGEVLSWQVRLPVKQEKAEEPARKPSGDPKKGVRRKKD
jgi:hypothetical protein